MKVDLQTRIKLIERMDRLRRTLDQMDLDATDSMLLVYAALVRVDPKIKAAIRKRPGLWLDYLEQFYDAPR